MNSSDQQNFEIDGGQQVGQNLFHSFDSFSVPTNGSALFNNPADITNIIGRVTGANPSNIDGIIEAQGQASLFLINPNGIIFGPNAALNIGGSFLASTADTVLFGDGQEFSALNTQGAPLLAISSPIEFPIDNTSGSLSVLGSTLAVDQGQSLSLSSTVILLEDVQLLAPDGEIDLSGDNITIGGVNFSISGGNITIGGGNIIISGGNITIGGGNLNISGGNASISSDRINSGIISTGPMSGSIAISSRVIQLERNTVDDSIPQDIITESRFAVTGKVLRLILSQRCRKKSPSKFVDTRRGGYPLSPADIGSLSLSSWEDLRSMPTSQHQVSLPTNVTLSSAKSLVEAQGWRKSPDGQIALVADTSQVTASPVVQAPAVCRS